MDEAPEKTPLTAELQIPEPRIVISGSAGIYHLNYLPLTIDEAIELYNDLGRALAGQNTDRTQDDSDSLGI